MDLTPIAVIAVPVAIIEAPTFFNALGTLLETVPALSPNWFKVFDADCNPLVNP